MIRWNCGAGKHVYINGLSFQLREIRISHIFAKINFATGSQNMLSFVKRTDIRQFREKFKKFSPFLRDFALTCFAKKMQIHEFNHIFCYFSHLFSMNGMGEMHVHMPNFLRLQAH